MYTLVCYRPEGIDTCRGNVYGQSSSAFEIHYFKKVKDAAMKDAEYQMFNFDHPREYSEWDVKVLVDGLDEDQWWNVESNYQMYKNDQSNVWSNYQFHLKNSISILKEQSNVQKLLKQEQEEQRKADLIAAVLRVKEENERIEYERLAKKFGELK